MKQIRSWLFVALPVIALLLGVAVFAPGTVQARELEGNEANDAVTGRDIEALDCSPERHDYRENTSRKCDLFRKYINPMIWFLSAMVGLAVTIGIIVGGIRYSASGGDPGQAAAAKKQIRNSIIALLVFMFLLAGLNWLIPGGLR